jgi:ribosomal protein S14
MKRNAKNITRDLIKRKLYIKHELKKCILKSIINSKNVKPIIRSYAFLKLINFSYKTHISKQINTCLFRGRNRSVLKITQLSRHALNKQAMFGFLQNTKVKS